MKMSKGERLVKLMTKAKNSELSLLESEKEILANYLIANGVIEPSCKRVYFIINKGTQFEYVDSIGIYYLKIYEMKDLSKYGFYTTREEAEKTLKGGAE